MTSVDQIFHNPNPMQLEGTYIFPIPEGAGIEQLSLWIEGVEQKAELLDADKARNIYEGIVRRMRDPALLEYVGRRAFKLRVFPIPARGERRVKLSYRELLTAEGGTARYLYPLNTEKFSSQPLERVLIDGLFFMAERLYGVTMHARADLPVYHEEVRVFEVRDAGGEAIALFYADYFARPSKRGGAWMSSFVDQSELLGQLPVVVNVMNIKKPSEGPTLLSFDDVTTMFHEFGHGVHGMFSRVRFPMLSGTNVPRDYVEFPSQFHEDFAFDPAVLERCARHYETGAPMPEELLEAVKRARKFGQGFAAFEYIAAAWLDLAWHSLAPGEQVDDVDGFERRALEQAGVHMTLVPPRYKSTYFAHIWPGGYSAGYYAYLWSEALAADGFAGCAEAGGMSRENGQRFRDAVLSRGFTQEPLEQFRAFRGRDLDTNAVLQRRGLVC